MTVRPILPIGHVSPDPARRTSPHRMVARLGLLLAALALLLPLGACAPLPLEGGTATDGPGEAPATAEPSADGSTASESAGAGAAPPAAQADGTALAMLEGLEQKGRAPRTGYDRESFGWRDDVDHNGCDTRNDVLRRDLSALTLKDGTKGCVVLRGTLASLYSGESVDFDRTASNIDIDHVVALSDAWQTGAASWDEERRRELANDPLNLLAVEAGLNRQKGDGDAATWLPPAKDQRCVYVSRQIAVKDKYGLWVKPAEADAMRRVLATCEGFAATADDHPWPGPGEGDLAEAREADPAPSAADGAPFENCAAAREAGAAPVHQGDPGYGEHLDHDHNGVGCE